MGKASKVFKNRDEVYEVRLDFKHDDSDKSLPNYFTIYKNILS